MRDRITSIRCSPPGGCARIDIAPIRDRFLRPLPGISNGGSNRSMVNRDSLAPISWSGGSSWVL